MAEFTHKQLNLLGKSLAARASVEVLARTVLPQFARRFSVEPPVKTPKPPPPATVPVTRQELDDWSCALAKNVRQEWGESDEVPLPSEVRIQLELAGRALDYAARISMGEECAEARTWLVMALGASKLYGEAYRALRRYHRDVGQAAVGAGLFDEFMRQNREAIDSPAEMPNASGDSAPATDHSGVFLSPEVDVVGEQSLSILTADTDTDALETASVCTACHARAKVAMISGKKCLACGRVTRNKKRKKG